MKKLCLYIAVFLAYSALGQESKKDTIRLFYLGGQSNMTGYGYNKDLPLNLKSINDVYIFQGNAVEDNKVGGGLGLWQPLTAGQGVGFSSNGKQNKLSDRFGLELSFAKKIKEIYPNNKIAIIKYSRNGSSIDSIGTKNFGSWDADFNNESRKNQYDYFLETVSNAFADDDIDNNDVKDILVPTGILWMQGESDADKTLEIANNYSNQLTKLMNLIKATFRSNNLPIVIGQISDSKNDVDGKVWTYCEIVQAAQEQYVLKHKNSAIIKETNTYKYYDKWHYDSAGYIDLGYQFADKMKALLIKN